MPLARKAIEAFADESLAEPGDLRWLWLASRTSRRPLGRRALGRPHRTGTSGCARELGDLTELPLVLNSRLTMHLFGGDFAAAAALLAEIRTIVDATGIGLAPYGAIGAGRHARDRTTSPPP